MDKASPPVSSENSAGFCLYIFKFASSCYASRIMQIIETKSAKETRQVAAMLAREAIRTKTKGALVIALSGELGAGKTTFVQGFATALGIKEKLASPTFVIMKIYALAGKKDLVHIDCYRLHAPKDLLSLGVREMFRDPHALVLIEWPEHVKKILPRNHIHISFMHADHPSHRLIHIPS